MVRSVIKLSENQKRVIAGLCLYPMESDSFISEKCGVKRSTFAIVKKRLVSGEESLLHPINLPNFVKLGAQLVSIGYARMSAFNFSETNRSEVLKRAYAFPNLVHSFIESNKGFALLVSKHFTDFMLAHQAVAYYYLEKEYIQMSHMKTLHFPTDNNGIIKLMEHGENLSKHFGLEFEPTSTTKEFFSIQKEDDSFIQSISPLGWQVFDALMRYPNFSVVELSELLRKPRNTITRWVRKLQKANLYQTRYIPDLVKMGLNIKVIMFLSVSALENEREKDLVVRNILNYFNPSILFVGRRKLCFFANIANYTLAKEIETKFWVDLNEQDLSVSLEDKFYLTNKNISCTKSTSEALRELLRYLRNPQKFSLNPYPKPEHEGKNKKGVN
ncbi:MAG: hypothetical protein ACTSPG_02375 [Candidatus Hodarchaeales archaeon]